MQAPLQQNLPTTELDGLVDLGKQRRFVENVCVGIVFVPVKGAELAPTHANIGVVDIPLDVVCPHIAGMELLRNGIGIGTERGQIVGV